METPLPAKHMFISSALEPMNVLFVKGVFADVIKRLWDEIILDYLGGL